MSRNLKLRACIGADQNDKLHAINSATKIPIAALIRMAVDLVIDEYAVEIAAAGAVGYVGSWPAAGIKKTVHVRRDQRERIAAISAKAKRPQAQLIREAVDAILAENGFAMLNGADLNGNGIDENEHEISS